MECYEPFYHTFFKRINSLFSGLKRLVVGVLAELNLSPGTLSSLKWNMPWGSKIFWVECSPMVQETWVQSQVTSYQRLLKWYLIPLCLTLSNIRYVSRVKWSNPRKGVAHSPTPWCSSYWKGSPLVAFDYGRQLYVPPHYEMILYQNWLGRKSDKYASLHP